MNKNKCRCECLKIKDCRNGSFWNVINCRCEFKKAAKLMGEEECKEITDIKKNTGIKENKTTCCFKYFICLCFSKNNWNYDLFLLKIKKMEMFYLIKIILSKKLVLSLWSAF